MKIVSLSEAREKGLVRYFTGKPCKRGHICERTTRDRSCVACAAIRQTAWRARNIERVRVWRTSWDKQNPEKVNAAFRRRYQEPEKKARHALRVASWKARNKAVSACSESKRRSRAIVATPPWADLKAIEMIYRVAQLARVSGFMAEVDHIVPLRGKSVSGLHVHNNLQIISEIANRSKGSSFKEQQL